MNSSFAEFGAFWLMWHLLALIPEEEEGGEQTVRTKKSKHKS